MAHIYPTPLPDAILDDPMRSAERRVCEALGAGLDDECRVFFGVPWLARRSDGHFQDGEVDLVVLDPRRGLLFIEVKGGEISRDGATGGWTSRDRRGVVHPIRNPVAQVVDSKYNLLRKIQDHPGWKGRRLPVSHAVAFPDCIVPARPLAPDCPRDIVIAASDLDQVSDRIMDLFARFDRAEAGALPLDRHAVTIITEVLAPTYTLRSPLGVSLAEDDRQIVTLSQDQFRILNMLARQRRMAIRGGAGTGKTLLAAEKARRLACDGARVLLTCFNIPLGNYLRASLGEVAGLEVAHFHKFCHDFAQAAGVTIPDAPAAGADSAYFAQFPDLLLAALDRTDRRFDAIVVDEGQDFEESWWDALGLCLANVDLGILYVFYDDQQSLYGRAAHLPSGLFEVTLDRNFRNTLAIHEAASRFYAGPALEAAGPPGRPIQVVAARSAADLPSSLSRVLHRLEHDEHVPAHDIAILTGRSVRKGVLAGATRLGAYTLTEDPEVGPGRILVHSIHRFKGLERRVVVLTDLEALSLERDARLLYVGISRARTHVVVVATVETIARLGFTPIP